MLLTALRAERLRNLGEIDLRVPEGLTVVGGGNGQGKTSLLEAVYLLGTGRSFRTRRVEDLVRWDGGPMRVAGRVEGRHGEVELAVTVGAEERALLVNGVKRGLVSFLGRLDVVDLTASRMEVLRGGPVERRRFLDRGVVGLDPAHLRVIREYRVALQQRNALLRRGLPPGDGPVQLDAWDERLVAAARELHLGRRRYAERLGPELSVIGPELLPDSVAPRLRYRPSPPELGEAPEERFAEVFGERLARCRGRDRELGHTSEGPHRDDLRVELEGVDLRRFGSAGQVRAAMIALKLGKLSLLREGRGEAPLFLLDDFDTDLDDARMEALAAYLKGAGFQALVATSKQEVIGRIGEVALALRMEDGAARVA
jgi:DNA replication and repair protein RecF